MIGKKKGKKILASVMAIALIVSLFPTGTVAQAAKIKISKKKVTLYVKKSTTLKIKGTKSKAKWSSSNKKVATVNAKGKVKARKKGTCKITAKIGKKKYTCKVTVKNPTISKKKMTIAVGKSATLKVTGAKVKSWSSSNKAVASVNKAGKVMAKKVGNTTITAKTAIGKLKCKITVVKATSTQQPANPEKTPDTSVTSNPANKTGTVTLNAMEFVNEENYYTTKIQVTFSESVELSMDEFLVETFDTEDTDFQTPTEQVIESVSADKEKKVYTIQMLEGFSDSVIYRVTATSDLMNEKKNSVYKVYYEDLSVEIFDNYSNTLSIPQGKEYNKQIVVLGGAHITKENVAACVSYLNMPQGLEASYQYDKKGYLNGIFLVGTCTAAEISGHKMEIIVSDPITKQKKSTTVTISIYDPDKISFLLNESEFSISEGEKYVVIKLQIVGGKVEKPSDQDYVLSLKSVLKDGQAYNDTDSLDLRYSTEEGSYLCISGLSSLQQGTYDFTIGCKVSEDNDPEGQIEEQTLQIQLKVLMAFDLAGTLKDGEGNKLPIDAIDGLSFVDVDTKKSFLCMSGEEEGKFQVKVPEGEYKLFYKDIDLAQSVTVSKAQSDLELTLTKLHKIILSKLVNDSEAEMVWIKSYNEQDFNDSNDIYSIEKDNISDAVVYMVEGTYTLFADYSGEDHYYSKLLSIFTVGGNGTLTFSNQKTSGNVNYYVIGGKAWISGFESNATAVTLPKKLDTYEVGGIVYGALGSADGIETLTIECELEQYYGLSNCKKLKKIVLSDDVPESIISELTEIENLEEVSVSENNKKLKLYDGALYRKAAKRLIWCPSKKTSIQFWDGTTQIEKEAFKNSKITNMTLPASITVIGDSAFARSSLTEITIPDAVTTLGDSAFSESMIKTVKFPANPKFDILPSSLFEYCSLLEKVTIPEGITEISYYAFACAENLREITFPVSLKTVYDNAFWECNSLSGESASIVYAGTKSQWELIDCDWTSILGGATVQCTDGTVTIEKSEVPDNPISFEYNTNSNVIISSDKNYTEREDSNALINIFQTGITQDNLDSSIEVSNMPEGLSLGYKFGWSGDDSLAIYLIGQYTGAESKCQTVTVTITDSAANQKVSEDVEILLCVPSSDKIDIVSKTTESSSYEGQESTRLNMCIFGGNVTSFQDYVLTLQSVTKDGSNLTDTDTGSFYYSSYSEFTGIMLNGISGLQAGCYEFTINCRVSEVIDTEGAVAEKTFVWKLNILSTPTVTGSITDAKGNKLSEEDCQQLSFRSVTDGNSAFYSYEIKNGVYSVKIPAGEYNLSFKNCQGEWIYLNQQITVSEGDTLLDIQLVGVNKVATAGLTENLNANTIAISFFYTEDMDYSMLYSLYSNIKKEDVTSILLVHETQYALLDADNNNQLLGWFTVDSDGKIIKG